MDRPRQPLDVAPGSLYAIVDVPDRYGLSPAAITRGVLADRLEGGPDGAAIVQLRAKHATTTERIEMLRAIVGLCRDAGAALVVNDDLEAALLGPPEISGVHLGQEDDGAGDLDSVRRRAVAAGRPDLWVGVSTHTLEQLQGATRQGPDYVAFGPVAPTRSKTRPDAIVGIDGFVEACRLSPRPVVAIGGLDAVSAIDVVEAGAWAVAAIEALRKPEVSAIAGAARTFAAAARRAAVCLPLSAVCDRVPVLSLEQLEQLASWSDYLGLHAELGLPARFRPRIERDGTWVYRPSDVVDLLRALDKWPNESWTRWSARQSEPTSISSRALSNGLVTLRRG